jgi:hypothetical protein
MSRRYVSFDPYWNEKWDDDIRDELRGDLGGWDDGVALAVISWKDIHSSEHGDDRCKETLLGNMSTRTNSDHSCDQRVPVSDCRPYLRPKPNAAVFGSRISGLISNVPSTLRRRKRSGLNISGSGYTSGSCRSDLVSMNEMSQNNEARPRTKPLPIPLCPWV